MKKSLNIWRVLFAALTIVFIAIAAGWYTGYLQPLGLYRPANALMVIAPYKFGGTWVFDDSKVGLDRGPFIDGIPEMIDGMVKNIPSAEKGFRLIFSTQPFPGSTEKLTWRRADRGGNWYFSESYQKEGWLCPALFRYYRTAPREIFVKAEGK